MPWVQQASDDFNRANETPLAGNWSEWASAAGNRFRLITNVCSAASNLNTDMATGWGARTWAQDQASKIAVTVTGTSSGTGPGPMVRMIDGTNTAGYYFYRVTVNKGGSNNVMLDRASNGVFTNDLTHFTVSHSDGDTYELRVQGLGSATVLTILRNDSVLGTYSDSSGLSEIGCPGMAYSSTTTLATMDDWFGYEFTSSADDPPMGFSGRGAGW